MEDAEDEQGEGGDDSEAEYSEDLKVFVGNLPFTIDSTQLAGPFEQAGSVEMVEVPNHGGDGKQPGADGSGRKLSTRKNTSPM